MGAQLGTLLRRPGALAIVAALGAYAVVMRRRKARARAKKRRERMEAEKSGGAGSAGAKMKKKRRRRPKDAMQKLFRRLWPFGASAARAAASGDRTATAGRLELAAIFAVSVMRTWHVNRMVYVKRDLMLATYKRNLDLFRRVIVETVVMSLLSSLIYATHRYLKERLSLIWREKLTKQLHRKYFSRMNYYRLSHLNRGEIADVEERMVKDPRRFCKSLAEEMEKASAAMTSGIWFTYKLTTISSLPFALAPLAYFYCSWKAALLFAPNWSVKWRKMLDLRSKYFSTQGRLQTHAEAVCAYQGNSVERNIIETAWNNFMEYCVLFMRDATLFEFVSSAFFVYGSHTMAATLILSRYISPDGSQAKRNYMQALRDLRSMPSSKSSIGGAASTTGNALQRGHNNASALLFSEIRYLTEYFIRAMSAQGVIIQVLRQLMQMQGPAGRLAELFDTLDKFDAETEASTSLKRTETRLHFATCRFTHDRCHAAQRSEFFAPARHEPSADRLQWIWKELHFPLPGWSLEDP